MVPGVPVKATLTRRPDLTIFQSFESNFPGCISSCPVITRITALWNTYGDHPLICKCKRTSTYTVSEPSIQRDCILVDAENMVLGRLASEVAAILRGKKKPIYSPHLDTGDHVIVVNASRIRLTGKKSLKK